MPGFYPRMHPGYDAGYSLGHWIIVAVLLTLFVALVAAGVVAVIHFTRQAALPPAKSADPATSTPEDVLRMRLASGEIGEDEFKSRMSVLAGA